VFWLVALFFFCALPAPAEEPDAARERMAAQAEAFDEVWRALREEFYDLEALRERGDELRKTWRPLARRAASDESFADAINGMLDSLETSHTRYFTRQDPGYWFLGDLFGIEPIDGQGYIGLGIFTSRIRGETFVRAVVDGGPAAKAGLVAGDRLVSVEGEPWSPIAAFEGREGREVTLQVQRREQSEVRDLTVVPALIEPVDFFRKALDESARVIERAGLRAAYVRVWSYAGRDNHDTLVAALNRPELASADGLVLDLRDGWGGASPDYLTLFSQRVPSLRVERRGREPFTWTSQWRKPVVLLVDETTRSGKEILAFGFRRYGYGPVVGGRTSGAVLGGKAITLGDDALLYVAVSNIWVDGERLEGVGVAPDVEVPFSLPYAAGADPRLERALEVLAGQVRALP
jgi:carboxyl-terminal processing protease